MDLNYTEDQLAYRDAVRRFVDRVVRPLTEEKYDLSQMLTREDIAGLRAEFAVHEIATTPPLLENGKMDLICFGIFIEEVSKVNIGLTSLANALFFQTWDMRFLLKTDIQKEKFSWLFEPGQMVCMGLSEPNVGSNPSQIETTARRQDGGWVINGRKLWTSHALVAGGIMCAARKVDEEGSRISLFIINERDQTYPIRKIGLLGMHAVSTCEVDLDDVWVPEYAELTPEKGGLTNALSLVEEQRLKLVFQAVGLAQAALDLAVEYSKVRTQFGRPIASFQLIQGLLADMATQTSVARLLAYQAASAMMVKKSKWEISMAKAYATEAAVRVTSMGIQVHGAMGLTKECAAERLFRDARMTTMPDGTTQIHQLIIGRELTGISAFV